MRARARAGAQPRTKRVVVEKATERIGERVLFAARDEDSSVADDLRDRSAGIADNGRTRGERFKSGQAEPLEERRVKQAFRARVKRKRRSSRMREQDIPELTAERDTREKSGQDGGD